MSANEAKEFNTFQEVESLNTGSTFLVGQMVGGVLRFKQLTKAGFEAQFLGVVNTYTYEQLSAIGELNGYIVGAEYTITDATRAGLTLQVTATSVNEIGSFAVSPDYPNKEFLYDFANNKILFIKSSQTFNKIFDRAKLNYTESFLLFGDSLTIGQGASNQTHTFGNIITAQHRLTISNLAVGGAGVWRAVKEANAVLGFGDVSQNIFWMPGFNDIRRAGDNQQTYNKIRACMNALISGNWLTEVYAGNDTQVTKVGSWSNINLASTGGKSNQNSKSAIVSTTNGNSLEYYVNGDNLIIGTFGCDSQPGNRLGAVNILVDDILHSTYNPVGKYDGIADDTYSNGQGPDVVVLKGLGSGLHKINIVKTDAYPFWFDYVGQLVAPQLCSPVLIAETTFMSDQGLLVPPANATNADVQTENDLLLSILEEWQPYPVYWVPTNAFINNVSGLDPDHIHWNDTNQKLMANAINTRL